jgi:hypothetical protein
VSHSRLNLRAFMRGTGPAKAGDMTNSMPQDLSVYSPTARTFVFAAFVAVLGQLGCAARSTRAALPAGSAQCAGSMRSASQLTPGTRTDGPWVGSSKSDVVRVRGLPDERRDDLWLYRASPAPGALEILRFSGPRVVSVSRLRGSPTCGLDG